MYVAAALCTCGLRAWKVGQIEQLTIEREKKPKDVVASAAEAFKGQADSSALSKSHLMRRMVMWKKV